ncbi:hypothetical protein QFC19_000554 [Naganishia cerealis]|uniref:Uncharacterized protein n=1 Tax=Naganishia cerealis TaxID=610337 RepID=A0ACC2WLC3_9TREE|nr:hypothetical protein QFC19_000554 [Naganishia cerealis]
MNCDGTPVPRIPPSAPRAYSQEQVGSFCARAARIGPEYESYESEWAASEVGEGVEEIWERNVGTSLSECNRLGRYHDTQTPTLLHSSSQWRVSGRQISTLEPRCFGSYETGQEITPSEDITYSLNELVDALSISGFTPYLTCINDTLSAIHWPVNTIGPFQDTTFAPSHFDGSSRSNCPSNGIVYPPAEQIFRPSDYTWDPMARPTMRPLMQVTRASAPAGASVTEVADEAGAKAFAPHEKQVVRKKLGLFKEKDRKMQDQRERQFDDDAKRHKRDEL